MQTVFSHIIQKRYSQSYEDIATDSLAYILNTYETTLLEMMRFLRGILPGLPSLNFRTQITEGQIRPDILGYSGEDPFVYIENKFWAGLTEHQPVSYLLELANYPNPTLLVMVVPAAREQMMISQLSQKVKRAGISFETTERKPKGVVWCVKSNIGPHMVLTSWNRLLGILESAAVDDLAAQRDLALLHSLCDAADIDRFLPINSEEITNQVTPALLKQMGQIIRDSVSKAMLEGIISTKRLNETSTFDGFGRYFRLFNEKGVGIWYGVDFNLWKEHGSPLWFKFSNSEFGRASEVERILKGQLASDLYFAKNDNRDIAISIHLETGVEKDEVVEIIMKQIRQIADLLATLSAIENE